MEQVLFSVPRMYADHHVLRIREVLAQLPGVHDIYASAALKKVAVQLDTAVTSVQAVQEALKTAGYGPGDPLEFAPPPQNKEDSSFWYSLRPRVTRTNRLDIEMSGDFRKY